MNIFYSSNQFSPELGRDSIFFWSLKGLGNPKAVSVPLLILVHMDTDLFQQVHQ